MSRVKSCETCRLNDGVRQFDHKQYSWWMCQECYDAAYSDVHAKYPFIGALYRWKTSEPPQIVVVLECKPQWLGARYVITSAPWLGHDQVARYHIHALYKLFEPVDNVVTLWA